MEVGLLPFMKRRAEALEGSQGALKLARVAGAARGKGKKEEDQIKDLVIALGELSVVNAAELREVCGISYVTFLVDSNTPWSRHRWRQGCSTTRA